MHRSITIIALACISFLAGFISGKKTLEKTISNETSPPHRGTQVRQGGFLYINPLLYCDVIGGQEAITEFLPTKKHLEEGIEKEKQQGNISSLSLYVRTLNSGRWIGINENDKYSPASLLKVAIMMAYHKLAESDPQILLRTIAYDGTADFDRLEEIKPAEPLVAGESYTIHELIRRMISYSGNNARFLLARELDQSYPGELQRVFEDIQIPLPRASDPEGDFLSAKSYSALFRVLYNATYLNKQSSENALTLLNTVDFTNGIVAGVPKEISVAHKFGERTIFTSDGGMVITREFHDCGIVYYPEHPYFLCIMTKGSDLTKQQESISKISELVYNELDSYFSGKAK